MELYIRLQLQTMGAAFGLGCGAMLVYDLLRTVRLARRRRAVTHVTDLLYVLAVGWALLRFALSIGRGELRLYVLPCAALGAFFSLKVLAPIFGLFGAFGWRRRCRWGGIYGGRCSFFGIFAKKYGIRQKKSLPF